MAIIVVACQALQPLLRYVARFMSTYRSGSDALRTPGYELGSARNKTGGKSHMATHLSSRPRGNGHWRDEMAAHTRTSVRVGLGQDSDSDTALNQAEEGRIYKMEQVSVTSERADLSESEGTRVEMNFEEKN